MNATRYMRAGLALAATVSLLATAPLASADGLTSEQAQEIINELKQIRQTLEKMQSPQAAPSSGCLDLIASAHIARLVHPASSLFLAFQCDLARNHRPKLAQGGIQAASHRLERRLGGNVFSLGRDNAPVFFESGKYAGIQGLADIQAVLVEVARLGKEVMA